VLDNLRYQLLGDKTYEIIIGSLDKKKELEYIVGKYGKYYPLVVANEKMNSWCPSKARNLALAKCKGEVIIFLDGDIVVSRNFIKMHIEAHKTKKKRIVIGCVNNYDENKNVTENSLKDIDNISKYVYSRKDPRMLVWDNNIMKWPLCWSGNMSIRREDQIDHNLCFDETFMGWGGEDLEWAYRAYKLGFSFSLHVDIIGNHLMHFRNVNENKKEEAINFYRFLKKWPELEVELVVKYGDIEANESYLRINKCLGKNRLCHKGKETKLIEFASDNAKYLLLAFDTDYKLEDYFINTMEKESIKVNYIKEKKLIGIATPYSNKYFDIAIVVTTSAIFDLFSEEILCEVSRVARRVYLC